MSHAQDRKQIKAKKKAERKEKSSLVIARIGNDILQSWLLLTVISATYSVYVVAAGTTGITPKIMVAPLAITTALFLLKKFTKQ